MQKLSLQCFKAKKQPDPPHLNTLTYRIMWYFVIRYFGAVLVCYMLPLCLHPWEELVLISCTTNSNASWASACKAKPDPCPSSIPRTSSIWLFAPSFIGSDLGVMVCYEPMCDRPSQLAPINRKLQVLVNCHQSKSTGAVLFAEFIRDTHLWHLWCLLQIRLKKKKTLAGQFLINKWRNLSVFKMTEQMLNFWTISCRFSAKPCPLWNVLISAFCKLCMCF